MLGLRERLQQLKSAPPSALAVPADPYWGERLARLRMLAHERAGHSVGRAGAKDEGLPGCESAPGLHTLEVRVSAIKTRLAGLELPPLLRAPWAPESTIAVDRLCFFDTETSGLCGGTGLKVFLLGVLRWQEGCWVLRQYLMTRPLGEAALIQAWQAEQGADVVLVSYNGKRFDVPALRTLETLHGRPAITPLAHWDLLYPVRRAFRGCWPDCRLITAERMLAGRERNNDLPGSEAPKAWRDYLTQGDTRNLIRVMQHNRSDLESLLRILKVLLLEPRTAAPQRRPSKGRCLGPKSELAAIVHGNAA